MVPGIDGFQRIKGSALFDEDGIGGLGPDEGFGFVVPGVDPGADVVVECLYGAVGGAA